MTTYGRVDVQIHVYLTLALVGGELSASSSCSFFHREKGPGIHCVGGWVSPRAGLNEVEKRQLLTLHGLEL
jgi:hypothetical protein